MIKKLISVFAITFMCTAFFIPEKVSRKADKVISKFYEIENFSKEVIIIPSDVSSEITTEFGNENLFKIVSSGIHLGYGYIGNAPSKTAMFDYLVLFDTNFIITKSKVLIYREEYGGEIGSKRWLKQFNGASSKSKKLIYNTDIIPISGATISVQSMTNAMNNLLQSIAFLQKKNQL